jgi:hypothetical protein
VIMDGSTNYSHVEVAQNAANPAFATAMNWASLNISGVQCSVWSNPASGSFTAYPYIVANGNSYGGTYNGWNQQCSGSCAYPSAGTWETVSFTPSIWTGTWSTDRTSVTKVGVDFNQSAAQATDYVIDQVVLY